MPQREGETVHARRIRNSWRLSRRHFFVWLQDVGGRVFLPLVRHIHRERIGRRAESLIRQMQGGDLEDRPALPFAIL